MREKVMQGLIKGLWFTSAVFFFLRCTNPAGSEGLAGVYQVTTFTLSGETTADVLALGGSLKLTLNASGSTSGTLSIPASLTDGEAFTADLTGTFTVTDNTIHFAQQADTFFRDLPWVIDGSQLRGVGTFSGRHVTVVLSRQ